MQKEEPSNIWRQLNWVVFGLSIVFTVGTTIAGGTGNNAVAVATGILAVGMTVVDKFTGWQIGYREKLLAAVELRNVTERANTAADQLNQLRQRLQPRHVTKQQLNQLMEFSRLRNGIKLHVHYPKDEPEEYEFGKELYNAFLQSGFNAFGISDAQRIFYGVLVVGPEGDDLNFVRMAIGVMGISHQYVGDRAGPNHAAHQNVSIWIGKNPNFRGL